MKIKEIKVTRYIIVSDDEKTQYPEEFIKIESAQLAMDNIKQHARNIYGLDL
jgi:hypothetical protein